MLICGTVETIVSTNFESSVVSVRAGIASFINEIEDLADEKNLFTLELSKKEVKQLGILGRRNGCNTVSVLIEMVEEALAQLEQPYIIWPLFGSTDSSRLYGYVRRVGEEQMKQRKIE